MLTAHAGLRIGEACRLRMRDVDLEARSLRVGGGKGGKARTVNLSTRLVKALEGVKLEGNDLVIGIAEHGARAALKRLCARAGVVYRAAHSFRHTAGTRLYEQTGDLNRVAAHPRTRESRDIKGLRAHEPREVKERPRALVVQ